MVIKRRDGQLLNGDGTAPNISGITDRSGIQTQAKGGRSGLRCHPEGDDEGPRHGRRRADRHRDAPERLAGSRPERTTDGIYIMGNPSDPEVGQSMWGLMVRNTPQQTENTAIVGAFTPMAQVFRKPEQRHHGDDLHRAQHLLRGEQGRDPGRGAVAARGLSPGRVLHRHEHLREGHIMRLFQLHALLLGFFAALFGRSWGRSSPAGGSSRAASAATPRRERPPGTSEVQTLTLGGTPTGGTFRLKFDGFVTGASPGAPPTTRSGTTSTPRSKPYPTSARAA
jgi:hypothetical protein